MAPLLENHQDMRYTVSMDDLSVESIAAVLTTRRLGRPVLFFPRVGSTNDVAREQALAGAPEGLLVVADEQTTGRGRHGRRWWAPPRTSLLLSLVLRPPLPMRHAGRLTMCLGLGALEGIETVTGLHLSLKWPNDLLLAGRKLGGMLTELEADGAQLRHAVLGLGVNVNVDFAKELPGGGAVGPAWGYPPPAEAISLAMALGRPVARLPLLAAILSRCEAWYDRLLAGESPHTAWASRLDTLGRQVVVTTPAETFEGLVAGVTEDGALLVRDGTGQLREVWSGDVSRLRPVDSTAEVGRQRTEDLSAQQPAGDNVVAPSG